MDVILEMILKRLGVELPDYTTEMDPTKRMDSILEWTIPCEQVKDLEKLYNDKLKEARKRKQIASDWKEDKDFIKIKKKDEP